MGQHNARRPARKRGPSRKQLAAMAQIVFEHQMQNNLELHERISRELADLCLYGCSYQILPKNNVNIKYTNLE